MCLGGSKENRWIRMWRMSDSINYTLKTSFQSSKLAVSEMMEVIG